MIGQNQLKERERDMTKDKHSRVDSYILEHFSKTNRQLSKELGVSINVIKYRIKKLGLIGSRKLGRSRSGQYDELIRAEYPKYSASIIADKINSSTNYINVRARQIGIAHNPNYQKKPRPIKENLEGKVYGMLLVKKQLGTNKWGQMMYSCVCECGRTSRVTAGSLKHGYAKSCGCQKGRRKKMLQNE